MISSARAAHSFPVASLRLADRAATVALITVALMLTALLVGRTAGVRPLIERSGSMAPAIATGDLLLSQRVSMSDVRIGDIVSFDDPRRPGVPTTHRVADLRRGVRQVTVTTRGDANPSAEQWTAAASGRIRRVTLRLPKAGYVMSVLAGRTVRLGVLALVLGAVANVALRRIWDL